MSATLATHVDRHSRVHVDSAVPCLVIAGPSGVGKGTIIAHLQKAHPGRFGFSVSHTTRNPRPGEEDGKAYHFVTKEAFEALLEKEAFLEHANVHGNYYGTSFDSIAAVNKSGNVCILDIDVQGARSARKAGLEGVYVFITPPSIQELERRLRGRGTETEESLKKRLETTTFEMAATDEIVNGQKLFDSVICNDILAETLEIMENQVAPLVAKAKAASGEATEEGGEGKQAELEEKQPASEGAAEATEGAAEATEGAAEATEGGAAKPGKKTVEEVSIGWMATHTVSLEKGQQCVLDTIISGGAKMGVKLIFKRHGTSVAHLLCKFAAAQGVSGFFEPTESGELIFEFDNTKASMLSFSKSATITTIVSDSPRKSQLAALVNHIQIQDLLDRCPADAPDVATALGSALTFSARNAELARAAYSDVLEKVGAAALDCRLFGVGGYKFAT